jgi:Divergent InlB B-repeat domain
VGVAAGVLVAAGAGVVPALRTPAHGLAASDSYVLENPVVAAHPFAAHRSTQGWCGTGTATTDRTPDAVSAAQVHVIYAVPADGVDRFASLAGAIVTDLAAVDGWWRQQDPTRAPRFDLFAFPGCTPGLDELDLSDVHLSQPGSFYSDSTTAFPRIVTELGATFNDPWKKYVVYYDGLLNEPRLCGQSIETPNDGGRLAYSVIYAQGCRADIGAGGLSASVVAHELTHNLGAVPAPGPPHACPGDDAHACDSELDLMYPYTHGEGIGQRVLDVGHDDYYAHSGTWWDVQDSLWLSHLDAPQFPLTVSFTGSTGSGTVTSLQPGIACPSSCSIAWDQGAAVQLTALPADGSRFVGWSGACTADPCMVTMNAAQLVVARFAASVDLTLVVRGTRGSGGTVKSRPAGLTCARSCSATFDKGVRLVLTAVSKKGSAFAGWGGACSGKTSCALTLSTSTAVTATFSPAVPYKRPAAKTKPAPRCKQGQKPTKAKPCRRP